MCQQQQLLKQGLQQGLQLLLLPQLSPQPSPQQLFLPQMPPGVLHAA